MYTRARDQPFCQYRAGDRTYYVFTPASQSAQSSIWKRIGPDSGTKWPKPPWRIIVIYILISFFSFSIEIVRNFHLSLSNNFYCDIRNLQNIVIPIINSPAEGWYGQPKYCCKKSNTRCFNPLCSSLWTSRFFFLIAESCQRRRKEESVGCVFSLNLCV